MSVARFALPCPASPPFVTAFATDSSKAVAPRLLPPVFSAAHALSLPLLLSLFNALHNFSSVCLAVCVLPLVYLDAWLALPPIPLSTLPLPLALPQCVPATFSLRMPRIVCFISEI